jgi:hypothetical protein
MCRAGKQRVGKGQRLAGHGIDDQQFLFHTKSAHGTIVRHCGLVETVLAIAAHVALRGSGADIRRILLDHPCHTRGMQPISGQRRKATRG